MRFEKQHAKSVNASAKSFQEEEEERERREMSRRRRGVKSSRAACLLTDVNKASHKLSAKRAER